MPARAAAPRVTRATHLHPADLRGFARLATQATVGLADLVEALHATIARPLVGGRKRTPGRTGGITGVVYKSVRGATRLAGGGLDALLGLLRPTLTGRASSLRREAVLAALNGVLGDYLEATGNSLAIPMRLRRDGRALTIERSALAAAIPNATGRIVILVHGLCLGDLQWRRDGHDHGDLLAREHGVTALYLHYNSGRHIAANGRAFAAVLEDLVAQWPRPIESLAIVAHSMGGLVARSACHYGAAAAHRWLGRLDTMIFLGTPHHGAPLERGGSLVDAILGATPYSAPFARLGRIRSAGITDLRHGHLVDDHRRSLDRFARTGGLPSPVPLPRGVTCCTIAATLGKGAGDLRGRLLGDGLVPVASALGQHDQPSRRLRIAPSRRWLAFGTSHMALLSHPGVSERIVRWVSGPEQPLPREPARPARTARPAPEAGRERSRGAKRLSAA